MRYAKIVRDSYVDGPGRRAVLFTQGCKRHCPGCQNRHLWPADGGTEAAPETLAEILVNTGLPITISGGEPFQQPVALGRLVATIKRLDPDRHVIIYTGYTLEELMFSGLFPKGGLISALGVLFCADVLVDGPYVQELDSPEMQYRGSSNQRVIDLEATIMGTDYVMQRGAVEPVTLDWDTAEFVLTDDGDLLAASPVAEEWADGIGEIEATRRCGETDART